MKYKGLLISKIILIILIMIDNNYHKNSNIVSLCRKTLILLYCSAVIYFEKLVWNWNPQNLFLFHINCCFDLCAHMSDINALNYDCNEIVLRKKKSSIIKLYKSELIRFYQKYIVCILIPISKRVRTFP